MSGKILIVDSVATNRIVLKVKLAAACYHPLMAADGESCLRLARDEDPDLILLDHHLRDMPGVDVLRKLRADPATQDIPVIVLSASGDAASRLQALNTGADDYLQKPVEDQILLARIRSLVRSRDTDATLQSADGALPIFGLAEPASDFDHPGLVALVADRADTAMAWRRDLSAVMTDRLVIMSREETLADGLPGAAHPDIFVVEADLDGRNGGLRLMSDLRSRTLTRHAAICIVCPDRPPGSAPEGAAMAFDLGANDVVAASVDPQELALRLRKLLRRKRAADRMRASVQDSLRASVIDPLTGLHNRRYATPYLAGIAERAQAAGLPYAVLVIDLDQFKAVNDRWGHAAGDAVLIEVALRLSANLREGDLLARVGGEEFLVGLPDTGLTEAQVIAERLCRVVQVRPIRTAEGAVVSVTASIGLAVGANHDLPVTEPVVDVMNRADRALLLAKSAGRNRVTISSTAA